MLCTILLFIFSIFTNPLWAIIEPSNFNQMIGFIKKLDLDNASEAEREQFMSYTERIEIDGSPEQKNKAHAILDDDDDDDKDELNVVATILESDVITPEVWQKNVMGVLKNIDATGSTTQKSALNEFIAAHKERILFHCKKLINSLYYDSTVKEALKFIIINTLIGVIPSLGLKSLSILAGNLPLATASTQLADLSVLCALDSIVRYGLGNQSEYITAPVAAGVSTAVQDFIGFVGPRPGNLNILGATITTPELAFVQAATMTFIKNNVLQQDNIPKIINNLDWQELAVGSDALVAAQPEEKTLIGYLQNALAPVLKNKTVRAVTATTLSYALEGAALAAALNMVGLGLYGASTTQALIAGMTRGALEGLFLHAAQRTSRTGIMQRVSTGLSVSSIQKYLTTGIMGSSMSDLVPLVTQQVVAGAVDGVVQKTGGWKKFVTSLFAR